MHPYIVAKIAHTQQSTGRIRYLCLHFVSSNEILMAAACHHLLDAIQISWPNIKNRRRYTNAFIYCGKIAHTQQSLCRIRYLCPLCVSSI